MDHLSAPRFTSWPGLDAWSASDPAGCRKAEVNDVAVDPCIGWCLTFPVNFTGHPAASVPAGLTEGLPVRMQVIGRLGADTDVLAAAAAVEQVRPWDAHYAIPAQRSLAAVAR